MNGALQALEQVLVVDDVAVFLVVAVQAIDAANGLEQTMVAHLLVDVEKGRGRGVKAGQQPVHHDQQLHLPWLVHELVLDLSLELVGFPHRRIRRFLEPIRQHSLVDRVLMELFRQTFAALFALEFVGGGPVGGDNGAFALEVGGREQLVELAGLVDAIGDQQGIASPAGQAVARGHVQHDVGHDLVQA